MPESLAAIASLAEFVRRHPSLFILTGAGISTASGIPDYRDADGEWKQSPPVQFAAFMAEHATRQRYWARSLLGWRRFGAAQPAAAHRALARLEHLGHIAQLCTQNVDGLHQAAGARNVIDLHGRLDVVRCMQCGHSRQRADMQVQLEALNPGWVSLDAPARADGDAEVAGDFAGFVVPDCPTCSGILKPDVVFFGERVPGERVVAAMHAAHRADAMLVIGSSLMVYSGFRFVQAAAGQGKPVVAINLGRTRADALLHRKIEMDCNAVLPALVQELAAGT